MCKQLLILPLLQEDFQDQEPSPAKPEALPEIAVG